MTVEDIFSGIVLHQIGGMMFHDQMAQFFDFLNLHGFKRMHEYHYKCESKKMRDVERFYINHAQKLLPENRVEDPKALPQSWRSYSRMNIDTNNKRRAVKDGFSKWVDWEHKTLDLYSKYYSELMNMGEIQYALKVQELVKDVFHELKKAERLYIMLENCDYDMVYLAEIQPEYHKKYKKMMKSV